MKSSNQKRIRIICLVALALGAFCIFSIYQTYASLILFSENDKAIIWKDGWEAWQLTVICGYLIGWTSVFVTCAIIVTTFMGSLKRGNLFPRRNISMIMAVAALSGISLFFSGNISNVMHGDCTIAICANCILLPLLIVLIGLLYRHASLAEEDSDLTI